MKTTLSKENLVGKFILAGHTDEGYFFSGIFNSLESAKEKFDEIEKAFGACEDSACITGSIEIIELSEDLQLFSKKGFSNDDLYDDFDFIEIPSQLGYAEDYLIFIPMNDCVIAYRDVEGAFLESL